MLHVEPEYAAGLLDLDGFSHAIVLYHMHLVRGHELSVVPFLDTVEQGIFATRSPKRPDAIGLSIVRIVRIDRGDVHVRDIDAVDGSPILDIKPYVPAFDAPIAERIGWLAATWRASQPRAPTRVSTSLRAKGPGPPSRVRRRVRAHPDRTAT